MEHEYGIQKHAPFKSYNLRKKKKGKREAIGKGKQRRKLTVLPLLTLGVAVYPTEASHMNECLKPIW